MTPCRILFSSASGADHLNHVKTQASYAITASVFALVIGTIPAGLGVSPWISLSVGVAGIIVIVKSFGKEIETERNIIS